MKKYIALLLAIVMLLLAACGTTQPPVDGTTHSTSATTGITEPSGTEATQDDTTGDAEDTTQQPSTDGTTTSTEDGAAGSTEPTTKPTTEPTTKPTTGNSSTDGTEQTTTQPTQPTQQPTQPPTQQPTQPPTQPPQPTESTKPSDPAPTVGTLTINTPNNTVVKVDSTLQLDYSYTGNKKDLTFKSMDTDILTVNNSGLITGKAAGAAQVRVYHGDTQLGSVRIKVEKSGGSETGPAAEKIVLDGTTAPWKGVAGNYMTFTAHAKTSGSNQKVTATSSNTSVATVSLQSTSGSNWCTFKVSFKSGGSTTITITSEDGKASTSYTVSVSGGYSCNPGGGQLTPEQFVSAANGVMQANGATISTGAGYRVLTLDASKLTWSNARSFGEGWVREFWGNGITRMGLSYEGVNDEGKHVFHIHA